MRCDLHVHTTRSGMCTVPWLDRVCRESYNDATAVHEELNRRGKDLVTVTDHDSIDAVEVLRGRPDFFLSEEVSCRLPSGTRLHMGVYDISERQHVELQRRCDDFPRLLAYLREQRLFFTANHVFSALTARRPFEDFRLFEELFPGIEALNGHMIGWANKAAAALAQCNRRAVVAGSDAHAMHTRGLTYTVVPFARDKHEFPAGVRAGIGRAVGESGSLWKLTRDVLGTGCAMVKERPITALLLPLATFAPLVTASNYIREAGFASYWRRRIVRDRIFVAGPAQKLAA